MSTTIALQPFTTAYADQVFDLIVPIQTQEFGIKITRQDQPDLAQVKALIDAEIVGPKPEPQRGLGGLLNRLRPRGSNSDPHN